MSGLFASTRLEETLLLLQLVALPAGQGLERLQGHFEHLLEVGLAEVSLRGKEKNEAGCVVC